jgi:hypothetical protein
VGALIMEHPENLPLPESGTVTPTGVQTPIDSPDSITDLPEILPDISRSSTPIPDITVVSPSTSGTVTPPPTLTEATTSNLPLDIQEQLQERFRKHFNKENLLRVKEIYKGKKK